MKKKTITHFVTLATLLLLSASSSANAQFIPAPTSGARATLTTARSVGKTIQLRASGETDNIWIDLNGNNAYDEGERLERNKWLTPSIQSQKLIIYGDLKFLGCVKSQLTHLDVSKLVNLERLYCNKNQLTSLDLREQNNLERLYCEGNQLYSLTLGKEKAKLIQLWCFQNQIKEPEMQKIVNALPSETSNTNFYPYDPNPNANERNQCTPAQVKIAKDKGWKVLTPDGKEFSGAEIVFTPAPINGPHATFTTTKAKGASITLLVNGETSNIWIDLNGNNTYDEGEKMEGEVAQTSTIQTQTLTVYGNLTKLNCSRNQLTKLDVSKLPKLTALNCMNNQLASLDLDNQTSLTELNCAYNQLTSLKVEKLANLKMLRCFRNQIASLDASKLTKLEQISASYNQLTSLNVSNLTKLTSIDCNGNKLSSLDLEKATILRRLSCYRNQIKEAEMQKLVEALPTVVGDASLYPYDPNPSANEQNQCRASQVKIAKEKGWKVLTPEDKNFDGMKDPSTPTDEALTTFTTTKASKDYIVLRVKSAEDNVWIDLNGNNTCDEGEKLVHNDRVKQKFIIQSQNLTLYGNLEELDCSDNQITSLDVSKQTSLMQLQCSNNQLTSLDLSKLADLMWLDCHKNKLTSLDLSKQTKIIVLLCNNNQFTTLDLSKQTDLLSLICSSNKLTSLDLSKQPNLQALVCDDNQLTSLDVSNLANLQSLHCHQNQITQLDVSKLTKLEALRCNNNKLSKLDVRELKNATWIACYRNQIKEAEMQKVVESLASVTVLAHFYPYEDEPKQEGNQCTPAQVKIAKDKGWKALYPNDSDFPGVNGLEDITNSKLSITLVAKEGLLQIAGLEVGMPIVVYTLEGAAIYPTVAQSEEMTIALPSGAYLLRIGNYSAKTIIP